jgi:hypothetical protein
MTSDHLGELPPGRGLPARDHLDDLTAMRLADGEPIPEGTAAHVADCLACRGRVATFRADGVALASALALDESDLAFLFRAQLPVQAAVLAAAPRLAPSGEVLLSDGSVARDTPATLAAILAVSAAGYAGWVAAGSVLAPWFGAARQLGLTSMAAQFVASILFDFALALWRGFQMLAGQPWIESPTLPVLVLALLTWAAVAFLPLTGRSAAAEAQPA